MFDAMLQLMLEDDTEQTIPLPTADEEKAMSSFELPESLPILALRNTVLFPGVATPRCGS
jgi:ATP-dependent Lon protease